MTHTRTFQPHDDRTRGSTVTTARTRLVGERNGWLVDALVSLVRGGVALRVAVARLLRAISGVVTPLGWTLAALVLVTFIGSLAWGWIELRVMSLAGFFLAIMATAYVVGRTRLVLELAPPPSRVAVGDEASAILRVRNPRARRAAGLAVDVPVGTATLSVSIPGLAGHAEVLRSLALPTHRRGRLTVGPVRAVRADPVGLVRRDLVWTGQHEIIVQPRTLDMPSTSSGLLRDLEGQPTRDLTSADLAVHDVREYLSGDDPRHIHWKSAAKTGSLMVRQFVETRRSHLVVALSLASIDFGSPEEFELAVSVTGSLGVRAIRDGRDVSVVVSAVTPEFAKRVVLAVRELRTLTPSRLLDDLAVVEHSPAALGILDVARLAGNATRGVSVVSLVVGSTVTPARLRTAAAGFPPSVAVLAIQCDPAAIPGRRRLAGLTVLSIGSLADLRRVLRSEESA